MDPRRGTQFHEAVRPSVREGGRRRGAARGCRGLLQVEGAAVGPAGEDPGVFDDLREEKVEGED